MRADFEGGRISSDGGILILRQIELQHGWLERLSAGFEDLRDPQRIEHTVAELLRQRVFGLALGYEDLADHEILRSDPALAVACEKTDPLGNDRRRPQDLGKPLAGKSTLHRLEVGLCGEKGRSPEKTLNFDAKYVEELLIDIWVENLDRQTQKVVLDFDTTDHAIHGNQEGKFFHGYYDQYCYLPLYVFCDGWPIVAWLRESGIDPADGSVEVLEKIVKAVRKRFPAIEITFRADSGFCRDSLMKWCEENGVFYVIGIARNSVLVRHIGGHLEEAKTRWEQAAGGKSVRVFHSFEYAAGSWANTRRVIAKAEWTSGEANPRFIVTNLGSEHGPSEHVYEQVYCARGNMENDIKQMLLDLNADRNSSHWMRANQIRLWLTTFAYIFMHKLRQDGLMSRVAIIAGSLFEIKCGAEGWIFEMEAGVIIWRGRERLGLGEGRCGGVREGW
ncbi:MAG: IS1380 family transposase [Bdellovibrionaceae bacterium]|nr:IS1380 family transposase [Pseudobdellovibrionaceae bacterium]